MEEKYFEPSEMVRGIQQLLISDKKKIAFLFGAGTSLAKKEQDSPFIPAIGKMTELVIAYLKEDEDNGEKYVRALDEIREELKQQGQLLNIETLLSNIEEKIRVIGRGTLNNLCKEEFSICRDKIYKKIQDIVSVHKNILGKEGTLIQFDLAKWICNADRKYGVEIFTTNYDYLFEIGLEANGVAYFDGFTGSYKPFFNADALEDVNYLSKQTKLWKIHGSLGLHKDSCSGRIIRMSSDKDDLLIYPSSLKYNNSKKQPYCAFMDRLNLFLKQDDAVLFVCGYSFGDEHINERILSALQTNTTAHVFVLNYDIEWGKNDEGKEVKKHTFTLNSNLGILASRNRKISVLATRAAIIGGQYGEWKIRPDIASDDPLSPASYFKEDIEYSKDFETGKRTEMPIKTCKGELLLPSFVSFVGLLKSMIPKSEWEAGGNE
ncbi:SIR2 family protein [Lacrimispora sp.]|uniref:SIR2 family protein n=1 Tax=Lacrimispora sp. TaxID=2719234 RepID=UPI0028A68440|nr:SIR2 family protein [Lacrimispora sp.]